MVSSFRYPLYSLFLLSFDFKSVTIFYHVKKLQCSSQNRACGFPAHGSSVKLTLRTTMHTYTIFATGSVPAESTVAFLEKPFKSANEPGSCWHLGSRRARCDMRANLVSVSFPSQCTANTSSSLCVLLLTPSSELRLSPGITPATPLL